MTVDTVFKRLSMTPALIAFSLALASITSLLVSIFFAGIMAIWGPQIQVRAQDWLGITAIKAQITNITGESRVTQQPPGMTYVREPVYPGEPITLVLHIGRTAVGAACILEEIIPLFMDDYGTTLSGAPRQPAQQLGPQLVRRELQIEPPALLRSGRATVMLQLEYTCGGVTVFESTYPVSFDIIPAVSGGR